MFYFKLEGDKLIFRKDEAMLTTRTDFVEKTQSLGTNYWVYKYYDWVIDQDDVWFCPELYKYIGNDFDCIFVDSTRQPDYKGCWTIKMDNKYTYNSYSMTLMHPSRTNKDDYKVLSQAYPTFSNWNIMKALIIGSDHLPVIEEYLPISNKDGILTHYNAPEYIKAQKDLGIEHSEIREIFKKNSQRFLDVYYPLSSAAGDVRSSIIYSCENTDQGQNIELMPASPTQRFNIWVKWMDIYGNLYDLYLYPGCSVDIRMCFTKKAIMKEDLAEGLDAVMERLPEKKPKKEKRYNGRPDGIVIEGADRYGFVHL